MADKKSKSRALKAVNDTKKKTGTFVSGRRLGTFRYDMAYGSRG